MTASLLIPLAPPAPELTFMWPSELAKRLFKRLTGLRHDVKVTPLAA